MRRLDFIDRRQENLCVTSAQVEIAEENPKIQIKYKQLQNK